MDDLLDEYMLFIDVLWKLIKNFESGVDKIIIIELMIILSKVLKWFDFVCFMFGVVLCVLCLVVCVLKVIF